MPYPNFGVVRTITLPYEEDMTSAQYLARYGIDLTTIALYDLVNIALDDVVYPVLYIDKENKILYMADRAFSYNGGLSIANTSLIQEVIEEGSIVNAKPIYYHPIFWKATGEGSVALQLTCVILDNNEEAYTEATFKAKIEALMDSGATIQCNGFYRDSNGDTFDIFIIIKISTYYGIAYRTSSGAGDVDLATITTLVEFQDGVNKIN